MVLIQQIQPPVATAIFLVDQGLVRCMDIFNIIMGQMADQQVYTIQLEAVPLKTLVAAAAVCGPDGGQRGIVHTLVVVQFVG